MLPAVVDAQAAAGEQLLDLAEGLRGGRGDGLHVHALGEAAVGRQGLGGAGGEGGQQTDATAGTDDAAHGREHGGPVEVGEGEAHRDGVEGGAGCVGDEVLGLGLDGGELEVLGLGGLPGEAQHALGGVDGDGLTGGDESHHRQGGRSAAAREVDEALAATQTQAPRQAVVRGVDMAAPQVVVARGHAVVGGLEEFVGGRRGQRRSPVGSRVSTLARRNREIDTPTRPTVQRRDRIETCPWSVQTPGVQAFAHAREGPCAATGPPGGTRTRRRAGSWRSPVAAGSVRSARGDSLAG